MNNLTFYTTNCIRKPFINCVETKEKPKTETYLVINIKTITKEQSNIIRLLVEVTLTNNN